MDRTNLRVIKGGPSYSINDAPKKFVSAFVTNTRLMGVLVLYVHWKMENEDSITSLHQFFYVETSETGIESYKSIYGNNQKALIEVEQAMIGGLGGEKVGLTEKETYILVQKYAEMTEKFGMALPGDIDEYGFIIEEEIEYDQVEIRKLFCKTCVSITGAEQLINYFLMRYISADFTAVDFLSHHPLKRDVIPSSKTQILCLNKVKKRQDDDGGISYMCESLMEDQMNYRILVTEIKIKDRLIGSFELISEFGVSPAEAAMKLARPEYITIFEIMEDRDNIEDALDRMYPAALQKRTVMGKVYLMFKNNNDHLKESFYRLNDDIKGIVYITDEDQLVLSCYTIAQIHKFENEMQYSEFGNLIIALAKYEFKESIFYDFMQSSTGDFLHYMEYVSDYDPDDE